MDPKDLKHKSRFLSLVLRHQPDLIGITLDAAGWVDVDELLARLAAHNDPVVTLDELHEVVRTSDKQRFALSEDGLRIRANQGHSVEVDLGYAPAEPPAVLHHGTAAKHVASIRHQGLLRGRRHHVHLSLDERTASAVGARHGKLVLLLIDAAAMRRDGIAFFKTPNNVWLTDEVPAKYLRFPEDGAS